MNLISLNTWGGTAGLTGLRDFLHRHKDTDIFCFQEIWNGGEHMLGTKAGGVMLENKVCRLYQEIGKILTSHSGYFRPHFYDFYGLAMFVKKNMSVTEEGEIFVHKDKGYISSEDSGNHARNIQYVTIASPKGMRTIVNFHGLWNGKGKTDSDDRLLQSEKIVQFLKTITNPYLICGDFNLLPETESLKKLEGLGLRNLITEFGIHSTRSSFYNKPDKFADYALVSRGITVNDFKILPEEVSDHLAMYLDFE